MRAVHRHHLHRTQPARRPLLCRAGPPHQIRMMVQTPAITGRRRGWRRARKLRNLTIGGSIIIVLIGVAIFAPWIAPRDPIRDADLNNYLHPPGGPYLMGADLFGRDVFSRILYNVFLALGLVSWTALARLVRGQVLVIRQLEYVDAARALGASNARIIFRHILPNTVAPAVVLVTLGVGSAILAEASLSFLGLGAQPPTPSWGSMLSTGRDYLRQAPWLSIYPGLAIFLTVIGFNLLGAGLRDLLDPQMRT